MIYEIMISTAVYLLTQSNLMVMPWILFLTRKKKTKEKTILDHEVTLNDFDYDEIKKLYRPVFIDSERKDVFVASFA